MTKWRCEMFGSFMTSLAGRADALETKITLYIVLGIVAIVIVSNLLDAVRSYIRGLDTAALGGLFLWLSYKSSDIIAAKTFTGLLLLIGVTLLVTGLLLFIVTRLFRGRGKKRREEQEQFTVPEEEPAKHMKDQE